jgi:translation initiation factor 2 alpha subunit (eIF-2alpha)
MAHPRPVIMHNNRHGISPQEIMMPDKLKGKKLDASLKKIQAKERKRCEKLLKAQQEIEDQLRKKLETLTQEKAARTKTRSSANAFLVG